MLTMPAKNYENQGKLLYHQNQQQFSYWLWHIKSFRAAVTDYVPGIEMSQNIIYYPLCYLTEIQLLPKTVLFRFQT